MKPTHVRCILAAAATAGTAACGGDGGAVPVAPASPALVEASGRYVWGFEASTFVLCGAGRGWWVASLDSVPAVKAYLAAQAVVAPRGEAGGYTAAFVRWRGIRSDSGGYGHLAAAPYAFDPRVVLEVRDTSAADCR